MMHTRRVIFPPGPTDTVPTHRRTHAALPPRLGGDIFERLAPEQSTRYGARFFHACGVGVPRGGNLDLFIKSTTEGVVFGVIFAIPAYLLGITFWQGVIFSCAFFCAYDAVTAYFGINQ